MVAKKQYSLRFKIWIGFFLVNIAFVTAISWALWQNKVIASISRSYIVTNRPIVSKLLDMQNNLNKSIQLLQNYALFSKQQYADESHMLWEKSIMPSFNDLQNNLSLIDNMNISPALHALLDLELPILPKIKMQHDNLLQHIINSGIDKDTLLHLNEIASDMMRLDDKINDAIHTQETMSNQNLYNLQGRLQQLLLVEWILLIIGVALSILFILIISNSITKPIQLMTYFTRNLANGNLNQHLELSASTEFEELSETLNLVVSSLNNLAVISDNIAMGDHSHRVIVKSEHDRLAIAINKMIGNFDKIVEQAYAISEGNFISEIKPRSINDKLGQALAHMTKTLRINKKISSEQHWLQDGVHQLASLLSETNEVHAIAQITLNTLCHYITAGMGAIYIYKENDERLHLSAGFAINEKCNARKTFALGEGLVGQVGAERKSTLITEISALNNNKNLHINSATSTINPAGIYIAPLLYEKNLIGVIEIVFYKQIREIDHRLLTEVAPLIAGHLRSAEQQELSNNLIKEIEKASEYKSEFLANMSHELRTPLNSLIILARLLLNNNEANLSADQLDSLRIIHHSAEDLLYLINDILDLSKVEAGKLEIQYGDIELSVIADTLVSQFSHVAKDKNIEFNVKIDDNISQKIISDEHRLLQILRNLIGNAIKFTNEGKVEVKITKAQYNPKITAINVDLEHMIQFAVTDSGIGISTAQQKFIFEPFRQADGSTSRRYGGTGLGLSISLKLTTLLGGFIIIDSQEGIGSTFSIYLPINSSTNIQGNINSITTTINKEIEFDTAGNKKIVNNLSWSVIDDIHERSFANAKISIISSHLKSSFALANILKQHQCHVEKIANLSQLEKCIKENKTFDIWFIDNSIAVKHDLTTTIINYQKNAIILVVTNDPVINNKEHCHNLQLSPEKTLPLSAIAIHLPE